MIWRRLRFGHDHASRDGGRGGCVFTRDIVGYPQVRHVGQTTEVLQLPGRRRDLGLTPRLRGGAWAWLELIVGILERVRSLLALCLWEPPRLLFPRELVPAFRHDDAEFVLTGLLVSEKSFRFRKSERKSIKALRGRGGLLRFGDLGTTSKSMKRGGGGRECGRRNS
jgi:hypothetical protein